MLINVKEDFTSSLYKLCVLYIVPACVLLAAEEAEFRLLIVVWPSAPVTWFIFRVAICIAGDTTVSFSVANNDTVDSRFATCTTCGSALKRWLLVHMH